MISRLVASTNSLMSNGSLASIKPRDRFYSGNREEPETHKKSAVWTPLFSYSINEGDGVMKGINHRIVDLDNYI